MRPISHAIVFYAVMSVAVPLVLIWISALYANWFSILDNALSDLGHATRSHVAPVFNTGLSLGGLLIAIGGVKYLWRVSRAFSLLIVATGYSLILVSVFDEVYGDLHFYVSVLFFLTLLISAVYYVVKVTRSRRIRRLTLVLVIASVMVWALHFALKIPRGAAIPELVSVGAVLPAYIHAYVQAARATVQQAR